ncbi:hypothetical protein [Streptomyces luteogriseus]|uniref:hypothetical protein n=1 Tax=Streptomyces luteogriseus TaxID=68233 RepID=UPI00380339A9
MADGDEQAGDVQVASGAGEDVAQGDAAQRARRGRRALQPFGVERQQGTGVGDRSARTEVRRLRRRELIRKAGRHASGVARTVTRIALVLGGMVAFVIGVLLYLHGQDGGTCLGAAAAA